MTDPVKIDPVQPTQDMKLPDGSTVVQAIMHRDPDGAGGALDIRCVLIGTNQYDERNPAHRFAMAVQKRIPEIMLEITGGAAHLVDASEIEQRVADAQQKPADDEPVSPGAPIGEAAAKQKLVDGLVALGHHRDYATLLVESITLEPVDAATERVTGLSPAIAAPYGSDKGLLPVFKVVADGDDLYFAAPTLERAKELLKQEFGDIPEGLLSWSETEMRGHPEGMFEDMGVIPE